MKNDGGYWRMTWNDQWQVTGLQNDRETTDHGMLLYKWPCFQVPTSLLYLFCLYFLFLIFLSASFCLTIIEIQRRKHRNKEKQQNWNRRWKRQNEVCTQDRQKCPTSEMGQNKTWAKDEGSAAMGCLLMSRSGRWRRKGLGKVCTECGPVCVHVCHLLQGNETETEWGLQ